ncbi:hypothetical protein H5410_021869, partial [Solanum commersonii]
ATYPISNAFFSDTYLPHEGQPTPYPTHSLELSTSENSAGGSFDEVSRNHRLSRRFTLWCNSSPSCSSLQHRRALCHWAT